MSICNIIPLIILVVILCRLDILVKLGFTRCRTFGDEVSTGSNTTTRFFYENNFIRTTCSNLAKS